MEATVSARAAEGHAHITAASPNGCSSLFAFPHSWAELWEFLNLLQETKPMAKVTEYYSINEAKKPADKRVYHDNDQCRAGRDIPQSERRNGKGGYRHCEDCDK
jgi:hypothetical protein